MQCLKDKYHLEMLELLWVLGLIRSMQILRPMGFAK